MPEGHSIKNFCGLHALGQDDPDTVDSFGVTLGWSQFHPADAIHVAGQRQDD